MYHGEISVTLHHQNRRWATSSLHLPPLLEFSLEMSRKNEQESLATTIVRASTSRIQIEYSSNAQLELLCIKIGSQKRISSPWESQNIQTGVFLAFKNHPSYLLGLLTVQREPSFIRPLE